MLDTTKEKKLKGANKELRQRIKNLKKLPEGEYEKEVRKLASKNKMLVKQVEKLQEIIANQSAKIIELNSKHKKEEREYRRKAALEHKRQRQSAKNQRRKEARKRKFA